MTLLPSPRFGHRCLGWELGLGPLPRCPWLWGVYGGWRASLTEVLSKHRVQEVDEVVEHVQVLTHPDVDDTAVLLRKMGGREGN